ncbi:hypothetical protein OCH239_21100 [Roseivivax halodurans JCM 10272]|uniref:ScyD/ScyE family protein n=2 Tax=Roseivivax halodurans TaxID=93683 RepID=X7EIC8_9RHOB|nr:hypothetical protein OCH239_21100 [Roseivivax halodurans JCM 10272]
MAGGASAATLSIKGVVLDGLANPRGMTFGADGWLYVTEAGAGGTGPSIIGGAGDTLSYGETGAITRWRAGSRERVAENLPSLAAEGGFGATGVHDVTFYNGSLYTVFGFGGDPNQRDGLVASTSNALLLGQVARVIGGTVSPIADIAALERDGGPDDERNSNPYGLTSGPDGLFVADAGGNDILSVAEDGAVNPVTFIPPTPNPLPFGPPVYQSVPTGIGTAPDGTILVSELTGFPFPEGAARVLSVRPDGHLSTVATGFTNLIDLVVGSTGEIFALETDSDSLLNPGTTGSLFKILTDGTVELLFDGLENPTGLAIGSDGTFYVGVNGLSPTGGQVLALAPSIAPVPLPAGLPLLLAGIGSLGYLGRRRRSGTGETCNP